MSIIDQIISWEFWTYIVWALAGLIILYNVIRFVKTEVQTHKYIMAVKNTPTAYEFIFRASSNLTQAGPGILILLIGYIFQFSSRGMLLAIPAGILLFYFLRIHEEIYQFEGDRIQRVGERKLPIYAKEVTGITIDSSEVNFHSIQFLNHQTFKAKRLTNQEWSAFTDAIEQFAERNNIPIENS